MVPPCWGKLATPVLMVISPGRQCLKGYSATASQIRFPITSAPEVLVWEE